MKRTLKRIEKPKSAPTEIQNHLSVVNRPLSFRMEIPTVGSLGLPVACPKYTFWLYAYIIDYQNINTYIEKHDKFTAVNEGLPMH